MREKESTTRKPPRAGVAISRRQLLVPKSSTARSGPVWLSSPPDFWRFPCIFPRGGARCALFANLARARAVGGTGKLAKTRLLQGVGLQGVGGWSKRAVPPGAALAPMGDRLTVGPQTLTLVV